MKNVSFIILLFTACLRINAQAIKLFDVHETILLDSSQLKPPSDFNELDSSFFEDEKYFVRKTCSGEFGGTIWFKDKKTGIEYSCQAICPVVVYKVDGKYIVSNTLAHLNGSSEIIEIDNPKDLDIFKLPKPRNKKGNVIFRAIGDDESRSTKGTKKLVDTIGVLTIASFPLHERLYHIITDFQKTYVAKIENNKFVTIDTISNESLWTYNPEVIKTIDHHYIVFFNNRKTRGSVDIYNNKINVIRFR